MNNSYFETFFDNSIEGILIIKNGFIINTNQAMLNILNYTNKDEIIGNLATGILIPTSNEKYLHYNNIKYKEISLISKDGKIIPAIIRIKDIQDNDEDYIMVFIQDLTDLKEKETLLIEQSRMAAMGEMISMIAHQWRQPLCSIGTAVSNLKFRINMEKYDKNIFNKKLDDVENYLKYMSKTIDDFRNFFKKDRDKKLSNIIYIANVAVEMLCDGFEKNSIKIENHNKIKVDNIFLYKNEFLQVLINILTNSKDAFEDKKDNKQNNKITIEYENHKDKQKIIISDNAGGIDEKIIDKIFEPYFSTKENKNGTGIGLYMSKTIIEKHFDGTIKVSNKNQGACFEITISK